MASSTPTNNELYLRLRDGDRDSFDAIFDRFYASLCAYGQQFVDLADAENIVQDVMLWLWENRERHIIEVSIEIYLFRAVKNRCLTLINHGTIRRKASNVIQQRMAERIDTPDIYAVDELMRQLREALGSMPESYREAFELNRFQGMSYKEIAERMNVSPKTVDYRIQQALKLLRVALRDFLPFLGFILYR